MSLDLLPLMFVATLTARAPLVVRTYDAVGVPPRAMALALTRARVTLAAVGIEPIWRPCRANGCVARPKPHEVEVRFVRATRLSARDSLGSAVVDVAEHGGTLATVYVDRVDALAAGADTDDGVLLGLAVAHEIGHLLLGTADHAPAGLMRATWKADEIRRRAPGDWMFTIREGAEMQRRLAGRREVALALSARPPAP